MYFNLVRKKNRNKKIMPTIMMQCIEYRQNQSAISTYYIGSTAVNGASNDLYIFS